MAWLYYALLLILSVTGLALNILGLPGLWLVVAATGAYAFLTSGDYIGLGGFITLFLLAVLAEILETALGGIAAKKAGGSKRAMVGAIAGGLIGAIVGTAMIPIPIIGTIIGACLGSFVVAFIVELLWVKRSTRESLNVGTGAAAGRLLGILSKSGVGIVMTLVLALWALPIWGPATGAPATLPVLPTIAPTTAPTTTPATQAVPVP